MSFTEEQLENVVIDLLAGIGYEYQHANQLSKPNADVLLINRLEDALMRINPTLPRTTLMEAIRKLTYFETNDVLTNNRQFHRYLTEGVEVTDFIDEKEVHELVKIIDYDKLDNNDWLVVNQLEITENGGKKRPDVVVYINGMPLVVMELKSTSREEVTIEDAYHQLTNYKEVHIPSLFYYNAFLVISDGVNTKVGTITASFDRFMSWKKIEATDEIINSDAMNLDTLIYGMFDHHRFLSIIKDFTLFTNKAKIMAQYHQYYGMTKAIASCQQAVKGDGRAGVIWHTQGSGKSFSMTFLAGNLVKSKALNNPTVVVLTDRNDLDDQLFGTFASAQEFLRQEPVQMNSRAAVKDYLKGRKTGGVVFSTIQKFAEETGLLSERKNIIVLVDEAHRTQYNLDGKLDTDTGKVKYGYAKYLRESFPNATYIAFTGTPIETTDKSTYGVFGDVIDIYDMTQAVEDGATVKIYYESRLAKVKINEQMLEAIDQEYWRMQIEEGVEDYVITESQKHLSRMESIICDPDRVKAIVSDLITHYEEREHNVAGKSMIVAYSRKAAYAFYQELVKQRPEWEQRVRMIMTSNNNDSEAMAKLIGSKQVQKQYEQEFRDINSEFKIVIVVDMWLTGFDVPSLDTMYIDKPMKAHNLMQAIARVNRVYPGKSGGLVVDYIGIKQDLFEALKTYTSRDQDKVQENEIAKNILMDLMELVRNQFHHFNYTAYFGDDDTQRYHLIRNGAEYVQVTEERKRMFMTNVKKIKDLYKICASLLEQQVKSEVTFFIAVRSFVMKTTRQGVPDLQEVNSRIAKMLENAILDDEILVLTEAGTQESFDLLTEENLLKLQAMPQKNIAANILMRVMKEKVESLKKVNLVKSTEFSDRLKKIVDQYNHRHDEADIEMIFEELIKFKHALFTAIDEGNQMELTYEEKAFFDVLTADPEAVGALDREIIIQIAQELSKTIKENMTHAWYEKEQARAKMRQQIRRLLKKYDYPQSKRDQAVEAVIAQATLQAHYTSM